MKQFTIPVQNSVEVIVTEVYIKVNVGLQSMMHPRTHEGKMALEMFQQRLNQVAYKLAHEIEKELESLGDGGKGE